MRSNASDCFARCSCDIGSWAITGQLMDVSTMLLFVTGVNLLAIGMLADMLNRRLP